MNTLRINHITCDTKPGARLASTISEAIELAKEHNASVSFVFSGVPVSVNARSKDVDVIQKWSSQFQASK